ncbi:type I-C CRISPR-associated protein Cas8c/Csd1 [Actinokineospora bangkokensis]|uniref:Type I-C CRISPR-associated protein Cas8c/Csd1 n=1 Tax=Actinokineospora bangkokensis TaxID=1193682 RepID=A0A1Q9LKQ9_9PSEU|nr:type I-C CRISPR-associated protein Cas8c/Csd1 [Actinokineospora bangkokensis]OLR92569.1 type I-C CRISPR-associated protein Cas8c/Csd1 [Actinokineospora bangkokensis]
MLLQRLAEHARQDTTTRPFHRPRAFQWQLRIRLDGTLAGDRVESIQTLDAKGRLQGIPHTVPAIVRTVGVAANLAADDAQYVLGWGDDTTRPERVARCHTAFVDLTRRWAASPEGRDDPIAAAVDAFYRSGALATVPRDPDVAAKHGVLLTVEDGAGVTHAYDAPSISRFWEGEVARRKAGKDTAGTGLCLVCGTVRPLLDTLPSKVPSKLVPGASNDAALVSVNERVFGYDLGIRLASTPICIPCGEAVSAGLVRVLSSPHSVRHSGQDSCLAWWTTEPSEFDPLSLVLDADPDAVTTHLETVHRGHPTRAGIEHAQFCAVTVGGNIARIMVRDWLQMPLPQLDARISSWFDDQRVTPARASEHEYQPLQRLVLVCGRWLRREKRYVFLEAKGADRPAGVERDLLRAAIRGTPPPASLLVHVINRVRSDGHLDTARAGLIRLCLVRSPLTSETPLPGLDPTNTDPFYVAGRVFAVLEAIQHAASDGKLNTTYGDRYFAGAITTPRAAIVNGRKDANAWLRKLRRSNPGAAVNNEKALDELFGLLDSTAIPGHASLPQQGQFLLGYHHQRAHRFQTIRGATATDTPSTDNQEHHA